jgi:plasmid stabilization system protein ParE
MRNWEDDLQEVLARLDVLYGQNPSDGGSGTLLDGAAEENSNECDDSGSRQLDASMLELEASAVQTDMEATLARLGQLIRAGHLDPEVREDVVFVHEALKRTIPRRASQSARDDWQITSVAAVLHLSRALMRLTFRLAPPLER